MYPEERQQAIASTVLARGRASVTELAEAYAVTTETVRRDLAALERTGVLQRVHGGAVPTRAVRLVEPGVSERESTHAEAKAAIGAAAADFFPPDGGTVLIDAGTTTARVADHIPTDRRLSVVTNSIPVAARLFGLPTVTLHLLGGRVRAQTQAAVGDAAVRMLETLRVDVAFLGANGVTVEHGLSTPDSEEAAVKRAMVRSANYVVAVADSAKLGRESFIGFAPITEIGALVTDRGIADADHRSLTAAGVEVVLA